MRVKNIPLFTTEFGVASLTLEKIPYTGQAYIIIQSTLDLEQLLKECTDFCCAVGAQQVFASGTANFEKYPMYTQIVTMSRMLERLPDTEAVLIPVEKETHSIWREIYNQKMRDVPNAAFLSIRDSEKLLQRGNGYFVRKDDRLIGIGVAGENRIITIAAVTPGGGRDTLLALCSALHSTDVILEVAENNLPAVKLYRNLDFVKTGTISRWYKIK